MNKGMKHVLIVDDEPDIINIIEIILNRAEKYVISGVANGVKALDFLSKDTTVDLVLADIKMPEMDGIELIKRIKDNDIERPKVMFVTGFTDISVDKLYDAGACGLIIKPFEWKTVVASVEECFKQRPRYDKTYNERDIKMHVAMELESLEAVQSFSEDFALGRGGMFLNTLQRRAGIGDLIRFRVDFKGGKIGRIEGVGEVVWQRVSGEENILLGVKFHNLKPELEHFVEDFCHKNKVRAFIPVRK
jgi:CheY-like chemotaxis protein